MYCVKCGNQLPDGANFCLNCDTPQKAGIVAPNMPTSSNEPPVAIDSVLFWVGGPHETKKGGFLRSELDGRGFGIAIYLTDSRNMWTAYPGKLYIVIRGASGNWGSVMTDLVADKSSIRKATKPGEGTVDHPRGQLAFYKEVAVSASEFTWNTENTKLGYAFEAMDKPTWISRAYRYVYAYCWYELANGKMLFQRTFGPVCWDM